METNCKTLIAIGQVDSMLKLCLVLLFSRHTQLCSGATRLSEWLCECPWALEAALEELADAGFLTRTGCSQDRLYGMEPSQDNRRRLKCLVTCYDQPEQRDEIYSLLHTAQQERQFQAWRLKRASRVNPQSAWSEMRSSTRGKFGHFDSWNWVLALSMRFSIRAGWRRITCSSPGHGLVLGQIHGSLGQTVYGSVAA